MDFLHFLPKTKIQFGVPNLSLEISTSCIPFKRYKGPVKSLPNHKEEVFELQLGLIVPFGALKKFVRKESMRVEIGILDLRSLHQTSLKNSTTTTKQDLMEQDFGISEPKDQNLISPSAPSYDSVAANDEIVNFSIC